MPMSGLFNHTNTDTDILPIPIPIIDILSYQYQNPRFMPILILDTAIFFWYRSQYLVWVSLSGIGETLPNLTKLKDGQPIVNFKRKMAFNFCPALTKLALDLHVKKKSICLFVCLCVCLSVFPVFFSRRLIG